MEEEIDLMGIIKYFWNKKFRIIILTLIFSLIGGVYNELIVKPLYTASTTLILVEMTFEEEADILAYSKLVDRYSVVASSRKVLEKVKENLKLDDDIDDLKENIVVLGNPVTYSIGIYVTDENPKKATDIANELAKIFKEEIKNLFADDKINVLDYAVEDLKPINDDLIKNVTKFAVIGAIIVCGYYFCIYFLKENDKNKIINKE